MKTLLLLTLSLTASINAATLSFSIRPTLTSGSDPSGISGSLWTFAFDIGATEYASIGTFGDTGFESISAELTIMQSLGLNGSYAISSGSPSGDFAFVPNLFGSTSLALQGPLNTASSFSFAGTTVSGFGATANPPVLTPIVGDPIDLAPLNNALYSQPSININGATFSYQGVVVPEPSSGFLALVGLAPLFFRRRR